MKSSVDKLVRLEFFCLCGIAFCLPLFEGPKHLFSVVYLGIFILRVSKHRESFQSSPISKYLLIFMAGSIISSIGAYLNGYEVKKLHDILRYSLIGWMILHTPLSHKQASWIIITLATSSTLAIIDAFYALEIGAARFFNLKSVGHINHSSIYILISIGACFPLALQKKITPLSRLAVILITALMVYALFKTHSRATIIVFFLLLILFIGTILYNYKNLTYLVITGVALTMTFFIVNPPSVINKFTSKYYDNIGKKTHREKIWNSAYLIWKKEPIFGIGYGNYTYMKASKLRELHRDFGLETKFEDNFSYAPHAHNRYMNTLSEGGLIGLLGLLVLLIGIGFQFLKNSIFYLSTDENQHYWLIGISTLTSVVIVGIFNTTLHHEHGLLAVILISLSFNRLHTSSSKKNLSTFGKLS